MFKPNRLVFKNNVELADRISSDWASVLARCTKDIEASTEYLLWENVNDVARTGYEGIRDLSEMCRATVNNILAPITTLDGDDPFFTKMKRSCVEVARSTLYGTVKTWGYGVSALAGDVIGLEYRPGAESWYKKIVPSRRKGILSVAGNVLQSGWHLLKAPVGAEPNNVMGDSLQNEEDMFAGLSEWGDLGPPHYRGA